MSKPILGYWDIRGLAEPIRFLLHSQGIEFEDKRYSTEEGSAWLNDKYKLGLNFPNLPYYIDDKVKLTQSNAILRYLARKFDMIGKTEDEKIRVDLAEQQIVDLRYTLLVNCYNTEFDTIKIEMLRNLPTKLQQFSDFLGDRKYLAGDNLTYVDFMACETFDFYRIFLEADLNDFQNLQDFQDRMENLPSIQNYLKSSTYKRWPILLPAAYIGGKGEEPKRRK